ncbi:MAG: peptide/nickel transport system permease protein [Solirubrobacteraceae bacterium]|nr:peptide/nickel transport system permease protein [Solirubrobacteraceae bacterium]
MTRRGLAGFAARRLTWAAGCAALASVIAFVVFWTIPNVDPEYALGGGEKGTDETRAAARVAYGLDQSLPVQFIDLMRGIFTGRLECYSACGNLREAFLERLPVTVWLVAGALVLAAALATTIALVCVRHHGRRLDRTLLGVAAALHSVPSLVLSVVLWTLLCERAELFPFDGYTPLTENPGRWAWHLALPWVAAALPLAGAYVPVLRAGLLEVRSADWVRTARAKGLSERAVVRRHVLRNALATPVTILGLDASHAFGGFVLYIETVFGVPGIGALTEASLVGLDLPAVVALTVWLAIVVALVNAGVDIVVASLDPRGR